MKKNLLILGLTAILATTYSCKDNNKDKDMMEEDQTEQNHSDTDVDNDSQESADSDFSNASKIYNYTTNPESVLLGKDQMAMVKLKDLNAIVLSDPDGKNKGMEFTYKVELTNKREIGGSRINVATKDFRLELDNGNKIASDSKYFSADAEETKTSDEVTFEVPAGAKPVAIHLFLDETRATVKLEEK